MLVVQNIGPDLDPNGLTLIVLLEEKFEKVDSEKSQHARSKTFSAYAENCHNHRFLKYLTLQEFEFSPSV